MKNVSQDKKIGIYSLTVLPLQVDFLGHFSMIHICESVLDSASHHATQLGIGLEEVKTSNNAWVLTRMLIQVEEYPTIFDQLKIETWVDDVNLSFSVRKFNFYNKENRIIASASTTWMLIDLNTRRPRALDPEQFKEWITKDKECLTGLPDKVESFDHHLKPYSFKVKYSDLDIQKHVNSGKYIEWVMDTFSHQQFTSYRPYLLQINYLAECVFDDPINIYTSEKSPGYFISDVNKNGKPVCRAAITWK
jgi:acyl-ACP thioesterase